MLRFYLSKGPELLNACTVSGFHSDFMELVCRYIYIYFSWFGKNKDHLVHLVCNCLNTARKFTYCNFHFSRFQKFSLDILAEAMLMSKPLLYYVLSFYPGATLPTTCALLPACHLFGTFPPLRCGYLTVRSLLHAKLSKPTRDALTGPGVGLVHQVGLIMQIPASSSLAWVKAVILMIKEW